MGRETLDVKKLRNLRLFVGFVDIQLLFVMFAWKASIMTSEATSKIGISVSLATLTVSSVISTPKPRFSTLPIKSSCITASETVTDILINLSLKFSMSIMPTFPKTLVHIAESVWRASTSMKDHAFHSVTQLAKLVKKLMGNTFVLNAPQ